MGNIPLYRYDDTAAFGDRFILIDAEFPDDTWAERITRAEFKITGIPVMVFENPVFPIEVNLNSAQTALLKDVNDCYLAVYDEEGRKRTCEGTLTFTSKKRVV